MKFRILEKDDGHRVFIQYKRRFWFWINVRDYADSLAQKVGTYNYNKSANWSYSSYKDAKLEYEKIIADKLEHIRRKKAKRKVSEEIDFTKDSDKFIASI